MLSRLFCIHYLMLISNADTIFLLYTGSPSGWSTSTDGSDASSVSSTSDSKCYSSPCLLIQAGDDPWKYARVERSFSLSQYTGLYIRFRYYCNSGGFQGDIRNCFFEYWCSGVGTQSFEFSASSHTFFQQSLSYCDQKDLTIVYRTQGGTVSNFGRAWIDNIELTGNTPNPTPNPTTKPTTVPSRSTGMPSQGPSSSPSRFPTHSPTYAPTYSPTISTEPTISPIHPTISPLISMAPIRTTREPTTSPSSATTVTIADEDIDAFWIGKEGVNCGDGYTDVDVTNVYYGMYCKPCPDKTAGTYGVCEECDTFQEPN
eukprot:220339_1